MNPARIWTIGAVVAVVAVVAAGLGLGVQPQLAAASAADASTVQTQAEAASTRIELAGLTRLAAKESALEATNTALGSAVTSTLRLSTFSRQVRSLVALDGVTLMSLAPGTAVPYASTATASTTGSSADAKAAVAPLATPGAFGKSDPLITAANFVSIPVTITVTGNEAAAIQFSSDLQHQARLFAVNTVAYSAGLSADVTPTTTISGNIYALQR